MKKYAWAIIGGGSGGLAAAKAVSSYKKPSWII